MRVLSPGLRVLPLRTPTLPPATHTNTYVIGQGALTVVDPGSPYPDDLDALLAALRRCEQAGERVERVFLTHHHHDHVGGARALLDAWPTPLTVAAHPDNLPLLPELAVDELLHDGELLTWGGEPFQVIHSPGHAPGHVALLHTRSRALVAGDLVAAVGTILISPVDGHLQTYLDSLARVRALRPSVLHPSHGEPIPQADAILSAYIAHRHARTDQVRDALGELGRAIPEELVSSVYGASIPKEAWGVAGVQLHAHLIWLAERGEVTEHADGAWSLCT